MTEVVDLLGDLGVDAVAELLDVVADVGEAVLEPADDLAESRLVVAELAEI
ncbi:hypothetical protein [Streptomyces atriruber]|uniref:hypothetical protein n=1 Tax=Streptomyces atriruber TaxID=545121 RepID=UPI001FC902AF|nr:hypothetical protein [Streptomyces atriruber]